MQQIPFRIRPIDLGGKEPIHLEPISLPNDLSGKMTISSKYAAVSLEEIAETVRTKDISEILSKNGREEIILETNTILKLARTKDLPVTDEQRKYWMIPLSIGFLICILGLFFFQKDTSIRLIFLVATSALLGGLVGFVCQKFYEYRLKHLMREWAKAMLED
ncbi:hypothetical protein IPN35_01330 [Candidatus Peregrinibacteria bacterium]|nr:MAG: hypothetical protein IPN35_01330 [Candidatus Peregrinibacteria bacterium]